MLKMRTKWSANALILTSLSVAAIDAGATEAETYLDQYPTQARVEYVFGCMNRYGGEQYNNMYACVCAIDKIAAKIPYNNFVSTTTLATMMKQPGERGGPFRDAEGAREGVKAFQTFVADTEADCGLKKPAKPKQ